ncbi:hypothetical protein [[Eubacterium] cellulosolvens]
MRKRRYSVHLMLFIIAISVFLIFIPNSSIADVQKAIIEHIQHPEKSYDGNSEALNLIIKNLDLDTGSEPAKFFFRIYVDRDLIFDEFPNTWHCSVGTQVMKSIELPALRGPANYLIEVELWWANQTILKLDSKSFSLKVVKLQVDWIQPITMVHLGEKDSIPLRVEFRNGGNDKMYRASLTVIDKAGLTFSPENFNLGDIEETKRQEVSFEVSLPEQTVIGRREPRFEISYYDFTENRHTETFSGEVIIKKAGTTLILTSPTEVRYASKMTLKARLLDGNNDGVGDQLTIFNIGDGEWSSITNKTGYAEVAFFVDLEAGEYEILATYEGSESYEEAHASSHLIVSQALSKLDVSIEGGASVDEPLSISAKLVDSLGEPIPDAVIEFWIDSQKIMDKHSDTNGAATAHFTLKGKGEHTILVLFNGSGSYEQVSYSTEVVLQGIKTTLSYSTPSLILKGSTFTLSLELKDEKGQPIPNADLKIRMIDSKNSEERDLITNQNGKAQDEFISRSSGRVEIVASYDGSEKFEKSDTRIVITILDQAVLALIFSICLIPVAAVLTFIELKTKRFSNFFSRFGEGINRVLDERGHVKQPPVVLSRRCLNCNAEIPESSKFCDICGATQEDQSRPEENVDEKVYRYIVERGGTISLSQASVDLNLSSQKVKESIDRLRTQGRLEEERA